MSQAPYRIRAAATFAAMALCIALSGCETTGDPRQGGLFGWSEEKALARQADLAAQESEARLAAERETRRGAELAQRKGAMQSEMATLQAQVSRLVSENAKLDEEARALMARRQLGTAELKHLRDALAASAQLRAEARQAAAQPASPEAATRLSRHTETLNRYNQQLYREVLLMMGR